MSEPRHHLRVLHISDLHERGPRETGRWRRYRVLGEAWERNLAELLQDGPIDLVCFTGDAADWGLPAEYDAATAFFQGLLQRLSLPSDRLFVIPGNHDIQRPLSKDGWERLRSLAPRVDRLELARWMGGGPTPLGVEDDWREEILVRQAAYRRWVSHDLGLPKLEPERSPHGRLGYRATVDLGYGFPIHVIGLDTAWLCGDDSDSTRLWLTDDQLMRLSSDGGNPLSGLRLALMHHPWSDLADGSHCRKLVSGRADLVLRGHLHEQTVETWADPDRTVRQLAAGSLYEGDRADHWRNACQVLTLGLDESGRLLRVDLRFRAFSPGGGHWHDDDSLYEQSRGGRLTWIILNRDGRKQSNPFDAWTPVTPPRFVGRRSELRRLEAALEEGRSLSLVGDWRMGKTSILKTWFELQNGRGREVRLLDGEKAESATLSAFVEKITGFRANNNPDEAADTLDRWAENVGRPGLAPLILIDEFDGMVSRFEHRFFERLRGMLGRVLLVVASRQEIDRLYDVVGRTSPFENRFELVWLGLLETQEAEELISSADNLLLPSDLDLLRHWAGRHPFYLQLFARHLVDARLHEEPLDSCLDRFRTEAAARLRELWRVLDVRDRESLLGIIKGAPSQRRSLRMRGLITEEGFPFGEVLSAWLREDV